jgi:hypothetical protein
MVYYISIIKRDFLPLLLSEKIEGVVHGLIFIEETTTMNRENSSF